MPKFRVKSRPFWDGVNMHQPGTVLEIDKEDYEKLLCLDFEGVDAQAKEDLKYARDNIYIEDKETGVKKKIKFNPLYLEVSGNLDPNKPKDLEKLHAMASGPRGAKVVYAPPTAAELAVSKKEEAVVVPQTAGLQREEQGFDPDNAPPPRPKVTRAHSKRKRAV